jgi:hypothetical protein
MYQKNKNLLKGKLIISQSYIFYTCSYSLLILKLQIFGRGKHAKNDGFKEKYTRIIGRTNGS